MITQTYSSKIFINRHVSVTILYKNILLSYALALEMLLSSLLHSCCLAGSGAGVVKDGNGTGAIMMAARAFCGLEKVGLDLERLWLVVGVLGGGVRWLDEVKIGGKGWCWGC